MINYVETLHQVYLVRLVFLNYISHEFNSCRHLKKHSAMRNISIEVILTFAESCTPGITVSVSVCPLFATMTSLMELTRRQCGQGTLPLASSFTAQDLKWTRLYSIELSDENSRARILESPPAKITESMSAGEHHERVGDNVAD